MQATQEVTGRLLKPEEAAARLGIRLHRLYALVRTQELPAVRLGSRQIRVDPRRLEEWIEAGGSQPEPGA